MWLFFSHAPPFVSETESELGFILRKLSELLVIIIIIIII